MPEIIDNVKVGNYIKTLLKEHGMTQEALADRLNISKSAVSQNLSGKSSFDLNNLVKICALFDVSLEKLLLQKNKKDETVTSEYERIVRKGLDELKLVHLDQIKEVDIYGKVIIEYIIELNKVELFSYLTAARVPLFYSKAQNAKQLYYQVILFMLQHDLEGIERFFDEYVQHYSTMTFEDERYESLIIPTLNEKKRSEFVESLMRRTIEKNDKIFGLVATKKQVPLFMQDTWMQFICRYHSDHLLASYLKVYGCHPNLDAFMKWAIQSQYWSGIALYLQLFQQELSQEAKASMRVQSAIERLGKAKQHALLVAYLQRGFYEDIDALFAELIEQNVEESYLYVLATYPTHINFKKAGQKTLNKMNTSLLALLIPHLTQDDKNFLLARSHQNDYTSMQLLFLAGARFELRYYRQGTYEKINGWLETLVAKKEEE